VTDKPIDPLDECKETVEVLKEENAELRQSAESFGELAERLNQQNRALEKSMSVACPRCGRGMYVRPTPPTPRGDLHCTYCGNSWRSEAES